MTEPALTARGPAHHGAFVEVAHGLVLAAMLAALAGMVDAIGYLHLSGLFVLVHERQQHWGPARPGRA